MKKAFLFPATLLALPLVAGAQTLTSVLGTFSNLVNLAIPLVLAIAVLYFFWGLAQYIMSTGNEEKRTEARNMMIWGIIALFVMVSVWGLIGLLQETFNVKSTNPIVPQEIRRR
ncbi:hypothetical protein A3D62_03280 [Candidatus Kaiserbacteria bacterium RIFCSPHIGHO2_02_FULL_49_11]|uniref:Uncharacterized protein n=1 Tax=Candidatus Kaiserbacteria bacterium RIFCSPHIGHO2_02_FULL_49_11 TaxID=1798489 RepID=A0A1F6CZS8_9BACT|nr:MAG: hypothetical protein A3D62_03280 [Candidatus Kaiserbacteria bacterium RIFCSPHIGHO2_02_FULL_49_11]